MKTQISLLNRLTTDRLILIPFTKQLCKNILKNDFGDLPKLNLTRGKSWPDADVVETLPKIIKNLSTVFSPTGFESWMIIKKETLEIIGDAGFKGFNDQEANIDIGYGIIREERGNGYAEEAALELIKWAFSKTYVKEITANCLLDNFNSIHLLHKLNFKKIKTDDLMAYWSLKNKRYQNHA